MKLERIFKQEISIHRPVFFSTQPIKEVLDVQQQGDELVMWYIVDAMPRVEKNYVVYGYYTGEYMPRFKNSQYIKTVQDKEYVYHLFIVEENNFDEAQFMTDQELEAIAQKYCEAFNMA